MHPFQRSTVARTAGVALLALVGGMNLGLGTLQPQSRPRASTRLDPAIIAEFAGTKSATRPSSDAVMGFSLPTQVREILVHGGDEVTKGKLLVKGDDLEDLAVLKLQKVKAESNWPVQRAQKTADLAKTEYEKAKKVLDGGGGSPQEVERAKLSMEAAALDVEIAKVNQTQEELQVDRLQARVDKFHLIAPFDGVVDLVLVDVGHAVNEQEKVIRVVNVDPLWMDVPAPTDDAATLSLKQGDKAWVLLDVSTGARIGEGKVIEVSPTTDLASRSRRIRVELANPKGDKRVLAGEAAWVRFTEPSKSMIKKVSAAAATQKDNAQASK